MIDPELQIGSSSIDLRLGSEFLITNHERISTFDVTLDREIFERRLRSAHEYLRVSVGEKYFLHEREYVLGTTLEYIALPKSLTGFVFGRSSWDRMGVMIPTTRIPPGFKGCVSLQLVSHADVPVTLVPGTRVCQLMLFPVSSPDRDESRYGIVLHPEHTRIQDDPEIRDLSKGKFPLILGITGTLASGKSEIATFLVREHGFLHLSLATEVHNEARRRGLQTTGDVLQDVGNDLRRRIGAGVLAERSRPRMESLPEGAYLVLEGIKNPAEVEELRKWPNFRMVGIDAQLDIRFERSQERKRAGSFESFDDFRNLDGRDRGKEEPEWGQQVDRCLELADFLIQNNSTLEHLHSRVEEIMRTAVSSLL